MGNRIVGSKAAREFALGRHLLSQGLRTPVPLAHAWHRRLAPAVAPRIELPPASYLLTLEWPNTGSIKDNLPRARGHERELFGALARFLARVHRLGFYHDDCSAEHILISDSLGAQVPWASLGDDDFALLDIDNGAIFPGPLSPGRRWVNLFQILRSVSRKRLSTQDRASFVENYLEASGLAREVSFEHARASIDRIARRKIGRSVFGR